MKLASLKDQIARDQYAVDPDVVAEAFIRRVRAERAGTPPVSRRDARSRAASRAAPPALNVTPGLARGDRAHARGAGRRGVAAARHAHSSKSSPPAAASSHGSTPSCAATSATPGASGSASRSISIATPLRSREMARVGGQAVGEVDHRARRPARASARPSARRGSGRR